MTVSPNSGRLGLGTALLGLSRGLTNRSGRTMDSVDEALIKPALWPDYKEELGALA